jgi:hypothetical protein
MEPKGLLPRLLDPILNQFNLLSRNTHFLFLISLILEYPVSCTIPSTMFWMSMCAYHGGDVELLSLGKEQRLIQFQKTILAILTFSVQFSHVPTSTL